MVRGIRWHVRVAGVIASFTTFLAAQTPSLEYPRPRQGDTVDNYFGTTVDSNPRIVVDRGFGLGGLTVSASQPLYRYANSVAYSQAVQQVQRRAHLLLGHDQHTSQLTIASSPRSGATSRRGHLSRGRCI